MISNCCLHTRSLGPWMYPWRSGRRRVWGIWGSTGSQRTNAPSFGNLNLAWNVGMGRNVIFKLNWKYIFHGNEIQNSCGISRWKYKTSEKIFCGQYFPQSLASAGHMLTGQAPQSTSQKLHCFSGCSVFHSKTRVWPQERCAWWKRLRRTGYHESQPLGTE